MAVLAQYGFEAVRADENNNENPDLYIPLYIESKRQSTPFRLAYEKFGITPNKCVTINVKNLERYKDLNCLIVFNVDYSDLGVKGFYCISAKRLWSIYQEHPERCYSIKFRGRKHKTKNFALSLDECLKLDDALFLLQVLFDGRVRKIVVGG